MARPTSNSPSAGRRKHREIFGFVVAWLEERTVHPHHLELMRPVHRNDWLRPQIEAKLATLDCARPIEADLHERVSLALELFVAVDGGHYPAPKDWETIEPWLSRALAYFLSTSDAIPDHFEDGFEDDHREFVAMGRRLGVLLDHFKVWNRHRGDAMGG